MPYNPVPVAGYEPDRTSPPTEQDIAEVLRSAGFWPDDISDRQVDLFTRQAKNAALALWADFEHRTGWHPFIASDEPQTRYFDLINPRGFVFLDEGLLDFDAVTVRGTSFTLGSNVWLEPANAAHDHKPYLRLRFLPQTYRFHTWPWPQGIAVTGIWGRMWEMPLDVWNALAQRAAVDTLSAVDQEQSVAGWSEDGFSEQFDIVGIIAPKDLLTTWGKDWDKHCERWRKVGIG